MHYFFWFLSTSWIMDVSSLSSDISRYSFDVQHGFSRRCQGGRGWNLFFYQFEPPFWNELKPSIFHHLWCANFRKKWSSFYFTLAILINRYSKLILVLSYILPIYLHLQYKIKPPSQIFRLDEICHIGHSQNT